MTAQDQYTPVGESAPAPTDTTSTSKTMVEKVCDSIDGMMPDVSHLYLQPLDPASDFSFVDRVSLIWRCARPWGDFFNFSAMNLPPLEEIRTRMANNVETYLYNYFLLLCLHLVFFSFGHLGSLLSVLVWVGVAHFLFVTHPDALEIGKISIDEGGKWLISIAVWFLVVFVGSAMDMLLSVLGFLAIVVGIHSLLREDSLEDSQLVGV